MIQLGENLLQKNDPMRKMSIGDLYEVIKNPKEEIKSQITQLRIIKELDLKQYGRLKLQLPYFVCGIFEPPIRRVENFGYISFFVVDIDKLSYKGISITELKTKICNDDRVVLCFESPGGDGLKVVFKLTEKCYDNGLYSLFYKEFCGKFSNSYNLEQVVDLKTSDVTRACFISYDSDVYYNENAQFVKMTDYIDLTNQDYLFSENKGNRVSSVQECVKDIDDNVFDSIKEILKLKIPKTKNKDSVYVPIQLEETIEGLKMYIESADVEVVEITNISYAKKIRVRKENRCAEINLFYGKRGFHPVSSPKKGTDMEFNSLMVELIYSYFYS